MRNTPDDPPVALFLSLSFPGFSDGKTGTGLCSASPVDKFTFFAQPLAAAFDPAHKSTPARNRRKQKFLFLQTRDMQAIVPERHHNSRLAPINPQAVCRAGVCLSLGWQAKLAGMKTQPADHQAATRRWLPDFCDPVRIFVVFVVTEMLVLISALSHLGTDSDFLAQFSVTSLFAQIIALNLVLILCKTRMVFNRLPVLWGSIAFSLLLLAIAWVYAHLALWVGANLNSPFVPSAAMQPWFVLRTMIITWLAGMALLRYFFVQRQWQKKTRQHAEARFMTLQARIKPHFLFNSLNSIASLIAIDPPLAEKAVENLADLFRRALSENRQQTVPLEEEIQWVKKYLELEKMRLGRRLQCEFRIDPDAQKAPVPAMCLQPLVENAILHGVQTRPKGGKICLSADIQEGRLVVRIRNPLPERRAVSALAHTGNGMALDNIRERLYLLYGHEAGLESGPQKDFYETRMRVPLNQP